MRDGFRTAALSLKDRGAAADLLTEAFFDNPAHTFIYPDEATRAKRLRRLMYINLGGQFAVGQSFGARDGEDRIAAMAFWRPPGTPKATLLQLVRFGFFSIPLQHGMAAFGRMTAAVSELERRRAVGLQGRESWYLNNMVVDRAYRGQGIGGEVLGRQLAEVVDPSGHPASLTTQKLENVSFYRRLGFEVTDDRSVGDGPTAFQNWIMVYR